MHKCPNCGNDDLNMMEVLSGNAKTLQTFLCCVCSKEWSIYTLPQGKKDEYEKGRSN